MLIDVMTALDIADSPGIVVMSEPGPGIGAPDGRGAPDAVTLLAVSFLRSQRTDDTFGHAVAQLLGEPAPERLPLFAADAAGGGIR